MDNGSFEAFFLLDDFLDENALPKCELQPININNLKSLKLQFWEYFLEKDQKTEAWIRNPFNAEAAASALMSLTVKDTLMDLSCDETLMLRFSEQALANFWISVREEYPELSSAALKALMPFTSTYLCEASFSALTLLKN
ncbi:hypothetical protein KIL84_017820 [Mauremys mutica]|uniref:HAT C-terminal dimerisation domain-containing protein n=1 Tax=Mauremys mutica TaxID=74926 RepID=A0A9D3X6T3_9SAUR|nr:hypothetical protein KIL84_017820 [Mauremys mutica]